MYIQKILTLVVAVSLVITSFASTAFASDKVLRDAMEYSDFEDAKIATIAAPKATPKENCVYESVEDKTFDASIIAVRRELRIEKGEAFRVKVFIKNTGNMPWFSGESSCVGPHMSLGTDKPRDRVSPFYASSIDGIEDTGWEQSNRIGMDQLRTDPGKIASFTFWSVAGDEAEVYKEYLTPMVEATKWIETARFSYEVIIGDVEVEPSVLRRQMLYAGQSGAVTNIDLNGEKTILVDISDQHLSLKLGDAVIRQFPVSTGKSSTPTPYGTTSITLKQEVRVGHAAPHYIMPKFMMFRAGGYGFHALPSLGTDGGVFWTEALSHIGTPVSHGCIRLLPDDANFIFDFTEIGTMVVVQP